VTTFKTQRKVKAALRPFKNGDHAANPAQLRRQIKALKTEVARVTKQRDEWIKIANKRQAELAHLERKNLHKCNDAWCVECDGPRPE
jgi:septal ring factor EnvC (AmiA/AmiB activator)